MLVVLLDVDLSSWSRIHPKNASNFVLEDVIEQVLVFLDTFLLLHSEDRIAVILFEASGAKIVFPIVNPDQESSGEEDAFDGLGSGATKAKNPADIAKNLKEAIVGGLKKSLTTQLQNGKTVKGRSGIAAALSTALCLLNRRRLCLLRKSATGKSRASAALEGDLSTSDAAKVGQARILTIFAGRDAPSQYVATMNCIFSAQRMGVLIDTCLLSAEDSTYLQQAAYLTSGTYIKPDLKALEQPEALLEYLLTIFLPDTESREFLSMPTPMEVDFRASCFITKKPIKEGKACSVCLSTFDPKEVKKAAACSVCGARYSIMRRPKSKANVTK